jgi:hypothetical protein
MWFDISKSELDILDFIGMETCFTLLVCNLYRNQLGLISETEKRCTNSLYLVLVVGSLFCCIFLTSLLCLPHPRTFKVMLSQL